MSEITRGEGTAPTFAFTPMDTRTPATAHLLHALHYMYRDAGNWKTLGVVLLAGPLSAADQDRIFGSLDSGLLFVTEQVGIPPLQRKHQDDYGAVDTDLDHAFHELIALRPASAPDIAAADVTLCSATTAAAFAAVAGRWDCTCSPYGRWQACTSELAKEMGALTQ